MDIAGIALAAAAATGLGLAIAVSRLAYEGGTNGLTVATSRGLFMVCALIVFCRISGRSLALPRRDYVQCVGLGLLMSMMFYGNVGSVEFISVGLAALLFYTFPPIVALINVLVLREQVSSPRLAAIAAAFLGLAIMLSASFADSSLIGVALALGAAMSAAWNAVWVVRRLRGHDPIVVTLHMAIVAAVVLTIITVASGSMRAPHDSRGWLGLGLVVLLQASSIPLFYLAMARIGALRSAMVTNVQPVVSIVAAYLLYSEALSAAQGVGGVLVIGAVIWMQWLDRGARARSGLDRTADLDEEAGAEERT